MLFSGTSKAKVAKGLLSFYIAEVLASLKSTLIRLLFCASGLFKSANYEADISKVGLFGGYSLLLMPSILIPE
jgi:hypothetical protein